MAAPAVTPPYALATFATSVPGPGGYTQPDSIVQWRDTVLVGFQNGVAKDGTDGKFSTIVQYSLKGQVLHKFSVKGHNDGLRIVGEDKLWALQNEDANPNLVVIDLETGQSNTYFPAAPHGGGYDDLVVVDDKIYMTASNPSVDPNTFPALVRVSLAGSMVDLETVLLGNADAVDIPTGLTVTLDLTDPDSLSVERGGTLVLNSQADAELVFIRHPLGKEQTVDRLKITLDGDPTTVDDTAFVPDGRAFLLVSDVKGNAVYRIDRTNLGFSPGTPYSSSDTAGIVGVLNLDNGFLTPVATGFGSTRGMVFVVPTEQEEQDQQ
jgi:antitoxin component of MazEF toxin-antitoxin module